MQSPMEQFEIHRLLDFRIGPPDLDDIYAASLGPARELEAVS